MSASFLTPSQIINFLLFDLVVADTLARLRDYESQGIGALHALRVSGLIDAEEQLEAVSQLKAQATQRRTQLRAGQ